MGDAISNLFDSAAQQPASPPPLPLFDCPLHLALASKHAAWSRHPIFTLAKRPSPLPRQFRHGRGPDCRETVQILPGPAGPASILDKDVFVFLVSRLAADPGSGPTFEVSLLEILSTMGRTSSGKDYPALIGAIERVAGMRIKMVFGNNKRRVFRLLDAEIGRTETGRVYGVQLTAPDWVMAAREIFVPLSPRYRILRRPLERRLYEIALEGPEVIHIDELRARTGIESPMKRFREMLRGVSDLPDYEMILHPWEKVVWFSADGE